MEENRIPNFTGDTNPFMPCLDSNGNYKRIFKIPIGKISARKAKKLLRELKKNNKTLDLDNNKNYFIFTKNK